jgi:hypothetical protein
VPPRLRIWIRTQPLTPEEAMELMKERWKAMNMMSTGTVMMLA